MTMAEILTQSRPDASNIQPRKVPSHTKPRLPTTSVIIPPSNLRNGHLNLDIFSPVDQNGSFAFDRVLRSGEIYKRTRKTKQWKKFYLVLRPNLLSIYKNQSEERLHKQINLSDLTAVAYLKDPKGRRDHIFGLFSPSRNYHFQANDEKDVKAWVELIRSEARIDEQDLGLFLDNPSPKHAIYPQLGRALPSGDELDQLDQDRLGSSSSEPAYPSSGPSTTHDGIRIPGLGEDGTQDLDYSGNEIGSHSDFSDTAPTKFYGQLARASISDPRLRNGSLGNSNVTSTDPAVSAKPIIERNLSQASVVQIGQDDERVIWQGYLLCLKSKGGVRQWKKLWVVLRSKNLAFYKTEEEYAALRLIPLSNIISAVEIDPVSRSKSHCMQLIAEEKNYRFCAPSEDALARCLGALKSQLARRKEAKLRKAGTS